MQKLFAVLLVLFAGLGQVVQAEEIKIVNGEVMIVPSNLVATGVKVTPEAQKYPQAVEKAFANPGVAVAVEQKNVATLADIFHYRVDTVTVLKVQYDLQKATVGVVASNEIVRTEMKFLPFFIFWVISVGAFFIATKMKNSFAFALAFATFVAAAAFAALAAFAAALAAFAVLAFALAFATFVAAAAFAAFAAAFAVLALADSEKEIPRGIKISFYSLMVLSAVLMCYPLVL